MNNHRKVLGLILTIMAFCAGAVLANPKINSVTMVPAVPDYGQIVTITIDYCADLYQTTEIAAAFSTSPAFIDATQGYNGQVFVISELGVNVPSVMPAATTGGSIEWLANTPNGYMAMPPCTDCTGGSGQHYTVSYVVNVPEIEFFQPFTATTLYLHVGLKYSSLYETDWLAMDSNCGAYSSPGWTVNPAYQSGAGLVSSISASPASFLYSTEDIITVIMNVKNNGATTIQQIAPVSNPIEYGTSGAALVSGPNPASFDLAASATNNFTWTYETNLPGTVSFSGYASGNVVGGVTTSSGITGSNVVSIYASPTDAPVATNTATYTPVPSNTFTTPVVTATITQTVAGVSCMLDDFEDGDGINKFGGYWDTYAQGNGAAVLPPTGSFVPGAGGDTGSPLFAAHISGTVGTSLPDYPAIGMETSLSSSSGAPSYSGSMDISGCTGIRFYVKGDGQNYLVSIPYLGAGGTNLDGYNSYSFAFSAPAAWTLVTAPFSFFAQGLGWGTVLPLNTILSNAKVFDFQTTFFATAGTTTVNLWIDEVQLYGCGTCLVPANPSTATITSTVTRTATPTATMTGTITNILTPMATPTFTATMTLTATPVSFTPGGVVTNPDGSCGKKIVQLADGSYLILGLNWNGPCGCYEMIIYRYHIDGTIDLTFGGGTGYMKCPGPSTMYIWDSQIDVTIDIYGYICITGYISGCGGTCKDMIVYRLHQDGSPDTAFGTGNGYQIFHNPSGDALGCSIKCDSSGNIYVTGNVFNGSNYDMSICRYTKTGVLDTSFGTGGCDIINNAAGGNGYDSGNSIVIGADGKIYVTGQSDSNDPGCSGTCQATCVWRFNSDGTLDSTFGTGCCSRYINTAISNRHCVPVKIVIDIYGRIYITGYVDDGTPGCTLACRRLVVIRMLTTGTIDYSFGLNGVFTYAAVGGCEAKDIIVGIYGNIIITGRQAAGANAQLIVLKIDVNGNLDTSFNGTGIYAYTGADSCGESVLIDSNFNLIISGYLNVAGSNNMMLLECPVKLQVPTLTVTGTSTSSPTATITATATSTCTATMTATPTLTVTMTLTSTGTATPTVTSTVTSTITVTDTPTLTATSTKTATATCTVTSTKVILACDGVTPPKFTVKMIINPGHGDTVNFDITTSVQMSTPPVLDIYPHGKSTVKPTASYVCTADPTDPKKFTVKYPKQSGLGDFDKVVVRGKDECGIAGTSDGSFDREIISSRKVLLFKNVINPDKSERTTVRFCANAGEEAEVKVYTRGGALVKSIYKGTCQSSDYQEATWNGTNEGDKKVASGIYIMTVKTPKYCEKEKIMVIR